MDLKKKWIFFYIEYYICNIFKRSILKTKIKIKYKNIV